MKIKQMTPSVGAEIKGVNIALPLDDEMINHIRYVLGQYGVVFFRDQKVEPPELLAFAKRFGAININRFFKAVDGFPEIASVVREPDQVGSTGWYWHTDHSYDQAPAMGSVFSAQKIPPVGGDTLFAGMTAAYEALSAGFKTTLETLEAWHTDQVCPEVADPKFKLLFSDRQPGLQDNESRSAKHPVVVKHPISNQKVLYVNPGFTECIDGWSLTESNSLLDYLYAHSSQPQFTYRHRWRTGDVAFWDNRSTWHCALDDCFGYLREFHRITIEGESLVAARSD